MKTVCAVSTPRGKGGIAVLRVSGSDAFRVALSVFKPKYADIDYSAPDKKYLRRALYGSILSSDDTVIDEGILVFYKGPSSFTGEDMAELSCHGGTAVTEEVYLSLIAHGASAAGPGEFTKRSFLNGKTTLTEAEAIGQLIDADTGDKVRLAAGAMSGNVSRAIGEIYSSLTDVMTALYAAIDYPEEDVGDEGEKNILSAVSGALDRTRALLDTYKAGRAVSEGVRTCVCGKPNVGKSSLFNRITGEESAIITSIPGTTRDILRENVSFGGVTLRLSDTAGMRDSDDTVEHIGVERAERELGSAELILAVFDVSSPLTDEDRHVLSLVESSAAPVIAVLNKADGGLDNDTCDEVKQAIKETVTVSAKTGEGMDALSAAVRELYDMDKINLRNDAVIWDVRQREILLHCASSLERAKNALVCGDPIDCICTLVEEAMAYLGETDGRSVGEEIVNEVFKRFCVGK
jgi:tRNA modification GTPase